MTAQGELVFGALGGLSIVRTNRPSQWQYQAPVVVTDLRVGGKSVSAHPFATGSSAALEIPPHANSLAVEFSALDYSAPERNRYAYRMDGVDHDWVETDATRRLATYANLPPGDYRLHLRGSNRNGEWSPSVPVLSLTVLPAWYQTLWFRALALLAALASVYGIVGMRTAVLRQRQHELERKVSERTAQLEAASRALEEASLTDPLTGLRNRRFLTQHLETDALQAIRRYESKDGAPPMDADLVFYLIDLDHFKQVNDVYGHPGGDAVLVQLPARIKSVFRETDYFIRWGGEEFLVVARSTSRSSAAERAERIRAAVSDTAFDLPGGVRLHKTCSIGFAAFPFVPNAPRVVSWEASIELADAALYAAKRAGRDGWVGLGAGECATAEGLVQRFKPSPAAMVANAEMAIATSLPMDAVVEGLGGER
ncbi:MAG: GGDEF domain-containing protein [Pseudomonadota bacterium]